MLSSTDEICTLNAKSAIQDFYSGTTVFITGGTGFMGKVLIQKLLRSCPDISEIILLIRSKQDKSIYKRLDDIFNNVLFNCIDTKCRYKVSVVSGDCTLPGLGLADEDRMALAHKVDVVFHAAATVRFNEPLSQAVAINVQGTKSMLDLARQMTKLKAFIHVSTAYSNCHLQEIEEKIYPPHYDSDKLMKLTDCLEKPYIDQLTPMLLKDIPNTYVYTKCIAEDLIKNYSKGLPVAIFRPSIVVATKQEPLPGWIDNLYGLTGVLATRAIGVMRSLHCYQNYIADIVPIDMVINALIATAWQIYSSSNGTHVEIMTMPKVYNYVSSPEQPIDWSTLLRLSCKYSVTTVHAVWYPSLLLHSSHLIQTAQEFVQLTLPTCIIALTTWFTGRQSNMIKIIQKVKVLKDSTKYFTTHQWKFHNDKVRQMWRSLSPADQQLFPFSFDNHDWESYFKDYMLGIQQYVLKDNVSTIAKAQAWIRKLYWIHIFVNSILTYFVLKIMWIFIR